MTIQEEQALVRRIRNGDPAAVEQFISLFYQRIYRIVFQRLGATPANTEDCQDLTSEIAWDCIAKIQSGGYDPNRGRLAPYIHGIINNSCKNFFKAKKRKRFSAFSDYRGQGPGGSGQQEIEQRLSLLYYQREQEVMQSKEMAAAMEQALQELDEKYRKLIYLKYYLNLSYEEISQRENLTVKMVKSRLFDARRKLEKILPQKLDSLSNFPSRSSNL